MSTGADGEVTWVDSVQLTARVDAGTYGLLEITSAPPDAHLVGLVGATVGPGFRRRLAEVLGEDDDPTSLTNLLLDDFPGAQLVAGYDMVHQRASGGPPAKLIPVVDIRSRVDLCAGWASDSTLIEGLRHEGEVPMSVGPLAPVLESADDDEGWHPMGRLGPGGMRRRRRLDVLAEVDGRHPFECHFRDSHVSDDGDETIVHEYLVTGLVDAGSRTLVAVDAEARVLPYAECPNALGERWSGRRLVTRRSPAGGAPLAGRHRLVHPPQRHPALVGRPRRAGRPVASC